MIRLASMFVLLAALVVAAPSFAQYGYPVQTVYDSGYTYTLYSSGNITRSGGWGGYELIDNGTGSSMIAAGDGRLYVLKNNGNIWMFDRSCWRKIDDGTGTARIWVSWGSVHCQKNNGQVWVCVDPYRMQWRPQNGYRDLGRVLKFERLHGR